MCGVVPARQRADGGRAEADQVHSFVGRVALEIAVQSSFALALGKRIAGAREVIEPDVPIARAGEHVRGGAALRKSLVAAGQRLFRNEFLVTLHPWHVGVAEQRDPVGPECERALGRIGDGGHSLMRQPVHQIEIDMDDAGLTQSIGGACGLPEALPAADRFLHARLEILHAEAGAIDAHIGQRGDVLARSAYVDRFRSRSRSRA